MRLLYQIVSSFIVFLLISNQASAAFDPKDYEDLGIYFVGNQCSQDQESTTSSGSDLTNVPAVWRNLINKAASKHPNSDPRLVAATLWAENRGWPEYKTTGWSTSSARASGPWQFIPSSWASMGQDGDGDGRKDIGNPADAVHAAFNHSPNSKGKPVVEEATGDAEKDYGLIFRRNGKSLVSFGANYNGSGAVDGVAIKDQPRGQNGDYVRMVYWLIASDFTKTFDTVNGKVVSINSAPSSSGSGAQQPATSGDISSCAKPPKDNDENGSTVSADGYAFPIWAKKKSDYFISGASQLPCPGICHHDGTPALDLASKYRGSETNGSEGAPVYAISDGTLERVNHNNIRKSGVACNSITFKSSKDSYIYWYGHLKRDTSYLTGKKVSAGEKIGNVGNTGCADNTLPHLHISRVPEGAGADSLGSREKGLIKIINKLYQELP